MLHMLVLCMVQVMHVQVMHVGSVLCVSMRCAWLVCPAYARALVYMGFPAQLLIYDLYCGLIAAYTFLQVEVKVEDDVDPLDAFMADAVAPAVKSEGNNQQQQQQQEQEAMEEDDEVDPLDAFMAQEVGYIIQTHTQQQQKLE